MTKASARIGSDSISRSAFHTNGVGFVGADRTRLEPQRDANDSGITFDCDDLVTRLQPPVGRAAWIDGRHMDTPVERRRRPAEVLAERSVADEKDNPEHVQGQ
jgi:hypothetical protein